MHQVKSDRNEPPSIQEQHVLYLFSHKQKQKTQCAYRFATVRSRTLRWEKGKKKSQIGRKICIMHKLKMSFKSSSSAQIYTAITNFKFQLVQQETIRDFDRNVCDILEGYKTVLLNQFQEANQMRLPSSKILISHQSIGNNENKHDIHA